MAEHIRQIDLPSGRTASIRRGKGRDLMRAHRAVAEHPEPLAISFALIAELAQIDDKPIVYEDIMEMDLDDVLFLQAEVLETSKDDANFFSTAEMHTLSSSSQDH